MTRFSRAYRVFYTIALMLLITGCVACVSKCIEEKCTNCKTFSRQECRCVEPKNTTCINGSYNYDSCKCKCDSGWVGNTCDIRLTVPTGNGRYLSAEVVHPTEGEFTFSTNTVDFELRDGTGDADTLVIDAYRPNGDWIYFEIYREISTLNGLEAIPLDATQKKGTAFGSYKHTPTGEILHTDANSTVDTIFIDEFSNKAGELKINGRFLHHVADPFLGQSAILHTGKFSSY